MQSLAASWTGSPGLSGAALEMDANLAAMMLADAQANCAEIGQTVVISGVSYTAAVGQATLQEQLQAGGLMEQVSISVSLPATSALLAASSSYQIGKTLTYNGRTYRVASISHNPGDPCLTLQVQDADQR